MRLKEAGTPIETMWLYLPIKSMSLQLRYSEKDTGKSQGGEKFEPATRDTRVREQDQQAEIDRLSRALDMFTYSASHDLRSPLTTMMGLINLAEISENEEERAHYFSMMRQSVGRLDMLIKEIVEITMNSKLGLSKEAIDFKRLLEEKEQDLFYLKQVGRVRVSLDLEEDAPAFYSDKNRVRVILSNLLSNAIKFADFNKEDPAMEISVEVSEKEAVLTFKDNGIGISERHIPNVFDMFYRAHEHQVGPGLGLYIVKETVNVLGGKIQIASKVEEGTSVEVRIPNI